jgi:hypothetical protein
MLFVCLACGLAQVETPTNRTPEFAIGLPRLIGNGGSLEAASYHFGIGIESLAAHHKAIKKTLGIEYSINPNSTD